MLSLIAAVAAGYWANQHIGLFKTEQNTWNLEIHGQDIAADLRWLWTTFAAVVGFTVATGRNTRHYCNAILIPWLAGYGVCVPLVPALMLPRSAESLIDFDALEDRITDGLPKFIA